MAFFKPCAPQLLLLLVEGRRPGLRPGGRLTFFVSPKKVSKERRPDVHALLRRVRCAAQLGRGLAKLAALKQTRALFPPKSALLAVPDGRVGAGTDGCCCAAAPVCFNRRARLLRSAVRCQRSAQHNQHRSTSATGCTTGTDFVSALASSPAPDPACPVGQGRAAECQGDQAPRLFERSEFSGDPPGASSAGNHEVALTSGRLSFGYFALAKQRKVPRPPGRTPGLRPQTRSRSPRAQRQHRTNSECTRHLNPQPHPRSNCGTNTFNPRNSISTDTATKISPINRSKASTTRSPTNRWMRSATTSTTAQTAMVTLRAPTHSRRRSGACDTSSSTVARAEGPARAGMAR